MSDAEVTAQAIAFLRRVESRLRQGWTQGAWARDAAGTARLPFSSAACRWCLAGALRAGDAPSGRARLWARAAVGRAIGDLGCLVCWNDTPGRTQTEVLAVVAQAIDLLARGEVVTE